MHSHLLQEVKVAEKLEAFDIVNSQIYETIKPSRRKLMKLLNISKSTYYDQKSKVPTLKHENKVLVQKEIVEVFEDSGRIYGANKIHAKLKTLNSTLIIPSRASISRYMHEIGINPIIYTRFNVKNKKEKNKNLFIITI